MFLAGAVAFVLFGSTPQQSDGALVFGGEMSCATWQASPVNVEAGRWWILGFWSGKNMEIARRSGSSRVGASTDLEGVIGEVRLKCQAFPSKLLVAATLEVFDQFSREER